MASQLQAPGEPWMLSTVGVSTLQRANLLVPTVPAESHSDMLLDPDTLTGLVETAFHVMPGKCSVDLCEVIPRKFSGEREDDRNESYRKLGQSSIHLKEICKSKVD